MAEDKLKGLRAAAAQMLRHWAELRNAPVFRLALSVACILVTVAALSIGFAGASHAQQCPAGMGLCGDGLCYPLGSQCCQGGGACQQGNNCWDGTGKASVCCPVGTVAYTDGYCAPVGISSYCGGGRYCTSGQCCNNGLSCCP